MFEYSFPGIDTGLLNWRVSRVIISMTGVVGFSGLLSFNRLRCSWLSDMIVYRINSEINRFNPWVYYDWINPKRKKSFNSSYDLIFREEE